jgi:hypothetical protein
MARSVDTIYNLMLTEKTKYASLEKLNNPSLVAIWSTIFYIVAIAINLHEQLWDFFKSDLELTARDLPTGTKYFYGQKSKEFQNGYTLQYNSDLGRLEYSAIDEEARIIQVVSSEVEDRNLILKVAKSDGADGIEKLSSAELDSFKSYINDIKFVGTPVLCRSDDADDIKFEFNIKVDKNVIKLTGESVSETGVYPIKNKIQEYLITFQNENYDSLFVLTNIIDAIQSVDGVYNVVCKMCGAKKWSAVDYIDVFDTDLQTYQSWSGYFSFDEANSTINIF